MLTFQTHWYSRWRAQQAQELSLTCSYVRKKLQFMGARNCVPCLHCAGARQRCQRTRRRTRHRTRPARPCVAAVWTQALSTNGPRSRDGVPDARALFVHAGGFWHGVRGLAPAVRHWRRLGLYCRRRHAGVRGGYGGRSDSRRVRLGARAPRSAHFRFAAVRLLLALVLAFMRRALCVLRVLAAEDARAPLSSKHGKNLNFES